MTHPNEQVVLDGFAAFAAGDVETLRRPIAPSAVWHNSGRGPLSGSHKGVDAILSFFRRTQELSGGTFEVDLHDVAGNDRHVFAAYGMKAQRPGKALNDHALLVFHVSDGQITEAWGTVGDQYISDDFWS
jgi:ketosteroid isomerase-like protein